MILATTIQSERGKAITKTGNEYIKVNCTVNRENKYEVIFYSHAIQLLNYNTGKSEIIEYYTKDRCIHDWDNFGKCTQCGIWDIK